MGISTFIQGFEYFERLKRSTKSILFLLEYHQIEWITKQAKHCLGQGAWREFDFSKCFACSHGVEWKHLSTNFSLHSILFVSLKYLYYSLSFILKHNRGRCSLKDRQCTWIVIVVFDGKPHHTGGLAALIHASKPNIVAKRQLAAR